MLISIRQLIAILDPKSRLHLALLIVPMLAMMVLEIVSIGLILPVIQVLLFGQSDGRLTKFVMELFPSTGTENQGVPVVVLFTGFFVFKNVLLLWMIYIVNRAVAFKTALFVQKLFRAYMSRPMIFHFLHNSANLLRNTTTGIGHSLETIRLALLMILDFLLMIGTIGLLVTLEPLATLGTAIVLASVGLVFFRITSPVFHRWGKRTMELEGDLIKWITQSFNGIRDAKLLHAEKYLGNRIGVAARGRADVACRAMTSIQIPRLLVETVVVIGFLGIVLILLSANQTSDNIISTLGLFAMAALRLMPSLNRVLIAAASIRQRAAYIATVHDDLINSRSESTTGYGIDDQAEFPFEDEIRIENVGFAYPDAEHHALYDINLTIQKGKSVGFIGESGAGKSTLMDIVLGLLKPETGRLLIDGKNADENLIGWHRHIGYVPQQVFIMDDTVRRNVALGIEDRNIDSKRMEKILQLARLEKVVSDLPDGLDTVLGEHGTRLSGGQRQRIAIARALYREPDVLVFDEATSALDNVTEREIKSSICALSGDSTVLIVAHRLNTIRDCDMIVLLKGGKVIGIGTYDELMEKSKEFQRLALLDNNDDARTKILTS